MAIKYHPEVGDILICDFSGMKPPEMVKRRPVVNLTPRFRRSGGLCTVVPLSTTAPNVIQRWHARLQVDLPNPYSSPEVWLKGEFLYTVSYDRLFLLRQGKDEDGNRIYTYPRLSNEQIKIVWDCVLHGLGRSDIVNYLSDPLDDK